MSTAEDLYALRVIANIVQTKWAIMAAEVFLYGAYVIMFAFYMHASRARNMAKNHRFLHISTITLFILATAHCALQFATTGTYTRVLTNDVGDQLEVLGTALEYVDVQTAAFAVYVTSTIIADSIFIFRCYNIWNRRLAVIVFPAFLVLVATGLGYANVVLLILGIDQGIPLSITSIVVSLFTTVVLMGLTVGRIRSLARAARVVIGRKAVGTYYTVCAMILESGALYCVFGVILLVVPLALETWPYGAVLAQVVGIAPTLISVRVALGCSVEGVNSFVVQPRADRSLFAAKIEAPTPESLDDRVLYIHATDHKAAI
ncbi:hypothetical protein B0H16DRAFT_1500081 [Mycena metata]|uniref:Uncharacterized protein n=1 Tax=Mycena metata TaxID=1033252 RepID=A0AAD7NY05_9AGAR|nr:hypothetical protein B0H16DRAFT_1500081 [Mycena metata]